MIGKYFKYWPLILLVALGVVSHLVWFMPGSILTYGDWLYRTAEHVRELPGAWGVWSGFSDFGAPNITLYSFPLRGIFWPLLVALGFSYDMAIKLTLMIPIAVLGFVAPYLLAKKLTGDQIIAFAMAVFYGATTYFIRIQTDHLPIAFLYALLPLLVYVFLLALERDKVYHWVLVALLSGVVSAYDLRIGLVFVFIFVCLYLSMLRYRRVRPAHLALAFGLILLLNAYWMLPTLFGGLGGAISAVAERGLFGDALFDLQHALTIFDASWTGGRPNHDFIMQPVQLQFWIIPVMAFACLFMAQKTFTKLERRYIYCFAFIAIVSIFLTKQSSEPLPGMYQWLYTHIPGFSLFREASKFYVLTALAYFILIGFTLVGLKRMASLRQFVAPLAILVVIGVSAYNLRPLLNGQIGTLFTPKAIPSDYQRLKKVILSSADFYRTYWMPRDSRWGTYTNLHPQINGAGIVQGAWAPLAAAAPGADSTSLSVSSPEQILSILKLPFANTLLDAASIKYVIVPLRDQANEDDFYRYYGDDRGHFEEELEALTFLKSVNLGTKEVTIYENDGYKPYLSAFTNLLSLDSLMNISEKFSFNTHELKQEFNFNYDKPEAGSMHLRDIFDTIKISDQGASTVDGFVGRNDTSQLYINGNKREVAYTYVQDTISFSGEVRNHLLLNGKPVGPPSSGKEVIMSKKLDPANQYYLAEGDVLTALSRTEGEKEHSLGVASRPVRLFSVGAREINLVPNGSFQKGLWEKAVRDCNKYDAHPDIDMSLASTSLGREIDAVRLTAGRHIACTAQTVGVPSGQSLLFGFKYQVEAGDEASYRITFNDPQGTVVKERLTAHDEQWHSYARSLAVPRNATTARIEVYGSPPKQQPNIPNAILYTDFRLVALAPELTLPLDLTPVYTKVPLRAPGDLRFSYQDSSYGSANIIPNPSLEKGLWQKKVGDCNAYDNNADIKMSLASVAKGEGAKKSLQLEAASHIACTGPGSVTVKENTKYLLSFDYQVQRGRKAGYSLSFRGGIDTSISEQLPVKSSELGEWHHFSKIVSIPAGATSVNMLVYAYSDNRSGRSLVRYDNFSLINVPDIRDKYYLVSAAKPELKQPREVQAKTLRPARKTMHVSGATTPFYLAMSEAYHPGWRLEVDNNKTQGVYNWVPWARPDVIPNNNHFKLNDFQNGWYVDTSELCDRQKLCQQNPDGSYDLDLVAEFYPRRYFNVGLLVSGVAATSCLIWGLWWWRKRKVRS
jgi:hypothetical protein